MSTTAINVTKRHGGLETLNLEKIHKVVTWAAEGLKNVSVSEVELKAHLSFYDGMPTSAIHDSLITAARDLISPECPDYQWLAGRLLAFATRKRAYGQYKPWPLNDIVKRCIDQDRYDKELNEFYTKEDFDLMDTWIVHDRDLEFSYAAMVQLASKYIVQDRVKKEIFESPQIIYMLVAATLYRKYPNETRMRLIREFYEATSNKKISLPTPIMAGVRTSTRQFSSCVLIESGDSIRSIGAATTAIMQYVAMRAGIGLNFGRIRAKGSPIRDGSVKHTG